VIVIVIVIVTLVGVGLIFFYCWRERWKKRVGRSFVSFLRSTITSRREEKEKEKERSYRHSPHDVHPWCCCPRFAFCWREGEMEERSLSFPLLSFPFLSSLLDS